MISIARLNGQTWLICGGRKFHDETMFNNAMSDLVRLRGMPSRVVHGGAPGADSLAADWGWRHALDVVGVAAQWKAHGRAAGPMRNQRMLDIYKPSFVIAFPGGRGTADMVRRAREAKIDVAEIVAPPAASGAGKEE